MLEVIFLCVLALIWILFAVVQDLKNREVANWLNFSLVIFALGFRFFYCLFPQEMNFSFFYQGLIGLGIFFVIGNLLYYGRMFAGGDAKLMIALGAILPFFTDFYSNLKFFILFFFVFLFAGAFYSLTVSFVLSLRNFKSFKKEFIKQFKNQKNMTYVVMIFGLILMLLGLVNNLFFGFGILLFILPYLYIYAKAVDESCMVTKVKTNKLTEGDWLYKNLRIGKKTIKSSWDGLTKEDIKKIKKNYKEIKVRQGIPFTPAFLISFIILVLIYFLKIDLWNSLW